MDSTGRPGIDTIDFPALFDALPKEPTSAVSLAMAGQTLRLMAFNGTGGWHRHDAASETVIVWSGTFEVEYRDRTVRLDAGQCTVIAPGDEHRGLSAGGAQVILLRAAEAG